MDPTPRFADSMINDHGSIEIYYLFTRITSGLEFQTGHLYNFDHLSKMHRIFFTWISYQNQKLQN